MICGQYTENLKYSLLSNTVLTQLSDTLSHEQAGISVGAVGGQIESPEIDHHSPGGSETNEGSTAVPSS